MRIILLISLLITLTLTTLAEEITTDNLVTNGNFETGNANGWNTSGDVQVLNDCCRLNNIPSNYDLEFGDSGSINQNFDLSSDTITQNMLDNGITLDSTIEVQNGECNVTGCWGGQGNADTFTNVLTIKDEDGNTLASNTTIRTDVTDINGANFTDRLIYNGTGSYTGNINISATDANAPATLGGPNVDNISVTMTYDNTVIAPTIAQEIEDIFESVEEVFEELEFVEIEELFEELITFFEEPALEMEAVEEFEEVTFEPTPMIVEEMPEEMLEEEMVEEEIVEEFTEEEVIEEAPTKLAEAPSEKEEVKEEKPNSETTKTATIKNENNKKQKTIQQKETIKNNLVKIMDKIDKDIKDISKNLQIKNIIKLDAMVNNQVSLELYDVPFYKSKDIYLDQVEIQDLRQLYEEKTLANYTSTDPIAIVNEKLNKINLKKKQILIELEQLKNG
tara:strand:+ start:2055 stop:3401 length:1347 start_codon:yes stop_codon:yes gene_type:complete